MLRDGHGRRCVKDVCEELKYCHRYSGDIWHIGVSSVDEVDQQGVV